MKHTMLEPFRPLPMAAIRESGIPRYKPRNTGILDQPSQIHRVTNERRNTREDALQRVEGYKLSEKGRK